MDRARFYELIDEAREAADPTAPSADPDDLREALEDLDDDELLGFVEAYERELVRLNDWRIWAAGYVAGGGMSDDGFHYFRSWIIGKGEEAVAQALEDPDGLAEFLGDEDGEDLENEELEYVALELLDEREVEVPESGSASDGDPVGEAFDEDTVGDDYPRLAAWAAEVG